MKFRRRCQLLNKPPDAVPLAGVFFLLLYFTLMRAPGVGVALPEMAGANLVPPGPVVAVAVDASGTLSSEIKLSHLRDCKLHSAS